MSDQPTKPDVVRAAAAALEKLAADARAEKATGWVEVKVHLSQGAPTRYTTAHEKAGQ